MEIVSLLLLSMIVSFFALLLAVKLLGGEEEDAQVWQIMVAAIFLFFLEAAGNYFVGRFAPGFASMVLVGLALLAPAFLVLVLCLGPFRVGFFKAIPIVLFFVTAKAGFAFYLGGKRYGEFEEYAKLLSLYERDVSVKFGWDEFRDPGWEYYSVGTLYVQLPIEPAADSPGTSKTDSGNYLETYWKQYSMNGADLRIDYWKYRPGKSVMREDTIRSALGRIEGAHADANVETVIRDFGDGDDSLDVMLYQVLLADPGIDPLAGSIYFASVVRGDEEWMLEVKGDQREAERIAQYSFGTLGYGKAPSETRKKEAEESSPRQSLEQEANNEPALSYPYKRFITNEKGQRISVTIWGRSKSEIIFNRDGQPFRYPIYKLSEEDRSAIELLPVTE